MKQLYSKLRRKGHDQNKNVRAQLTLSSTSTPSSTPDLHLIYEDPEPSVDVVALHGHGGHYEDSWTDRATRCFWLRDLLPGAFHNARGEAAQPALQISLLSFEYTKQDEEKLNGAEGVATILLKKLEEKRVNSRRPIVWVAHSFGGPLLKGALSMSNNGYMGIKEDTKCALFFGVPKDGEGWNNLHAAMTADSAGKEDELTEPMKKMRSELKWLAHGEEAFRELRQHNTLLAKWFIENSGGPGNRVEEHKAHAPDVIQMAGTHGQVIRFKGPADEEWQKVESILVIAATDLLAETNVSRD